MPTPEWSPAALIFVSVDYELAVGAYDVVYGVAFYVDEFVYPSAGVGDAFDATAICSMRRRSLDRVRKRKVIGCFLWSWISEVLLKVPPTFGCTE